MSAVLDTHAAIWYFHRPEYLSSRAFRRLQRSVAHALPVYVSVISLVETIYLVETGRLPLKALQQLEAGLRDPESGLTVHPVTEEVVQSVYGIPRTAVPDMPDRIIAATALYLKLPLVTRDRRIQAAGIQTIW